MTFTAEPNAGLSGVNVTLIAEVIPIGVPGTVHVEPTQIGIMNRMAAPFVMTARLCAGWISIVMTGSAIFGIVTRRLTMTRAPGERRMI